MKNLLAAMIVVSCLGVARAQTYQVVPSCGQAAPAPGNGMGYMDTRGNICMSGSGSGAPSSVTIVGPNGPEGGVSVSINPYRTDAVNHSGTITVGGAWQMVAPNNPLRFRFFIQNLCGAQTQGIAATESIFLNLGPTLPTTLDGAIELVTCGSYDSSSAVLNTQPVWLYAASTGHKFVALEW